MWTKCIKYNSTILLVIQTHKHVLYYYSHYTNYTNYTHNTHNTHNTQSQLLHTIIMYTQYSTFLLLLFLSVSLCLHHCCFFFFLANFLQSSFTFQQLFYVTKYIQTNHDTNHICINSYPSQNVPITRTNQIFLKCQFGVCRDLNPG